MPLVVFTRAGVRVNTAAGAGVEEFVMAAPTNCATVKIFRLN
jgi:hypothetical protein